MGFTREKANAAKTVGQAVSSPTENKCPSDKWKKQAKLLIEFHSKIFVMGTI